MYDPPICRKTPAGGVCEMWTTYLWSAARGHDGYSHAPVLITAIGLEEQFWVQVEGAPLDCFAILLCSFGPVRQEEYCQPPSPMAAQEAVPWIAEDAEFISMSQ